MERPGAAISDEGIVGGIKTLTGRDESHRLRDIIVGNGQDRARRLDDADTQWLGDGVLYCESGAFGLNW